MHFFNTCQRLQNTNKTLTSTLPSYLYFSCHLQLHFFHTCRLLQTTKIHPRVFHYFSCHLSLHFSPTCRLLQSTNIHFIVYLYSPFHLSQYLLHTFLKTTSIHLHIALPSRLPEPFIASLSSYATCHCTLYSPIATLTAATLVHVLCSCSSIGIVLRAGYLLSFPGATLYCFSYFPISLFSCLFPLSYLTYLFLPIYVPYLT